MFGSLQEKKGVLDEYHMYRNLAEENIGPLLKYTHLRGNGFDALPVTF